MSAMLNRPQQGQPQPEASQQQQEQSSTVGVLDDEDQDYDDTAVHDEPFGQAGERHGPDGNPTESFAVRLWPTLAPFRSA